MFDQIKAKILSDLSSNNDDFSPQGFVDPPILPLLDVLNGKKDYVSTSSCSGRVSVFLEGQKASAGLGAKGAGGRWVFVTHEKHNLDIEWWTTKGQIQIKDDTVTGSETSSTVSADSPPRYLLYKFEPVVLHVKCRDWAAATKLYSAAMGCGFRESGIGPNLNVAIRTSLRLDVPIAILKEALVPLVTDEYLKTLISLSTELFDKNEAKIDQLKSAIDAIDAVEAPIEVETKEQRRERKMREGLKRAEEKRAAAKSANSVESSAVTEAEESTEVINIV